MFTATAFQMSLMTTGAVADERRTRDILDAGESIGFILLDAGRILDRLEADGWAERRPVPGDRRARSIVITQAARELLPLIRGVAEQSQRETLAGLSSQETRMLALALLRMLANLSSCQSSAATPSP